MNIQYYFQNREELEKKYNFFVEKRQLIEKENAKNLIGAHVSKAEHNLKMLDLLTDEFNDWKIISLYYVLYHSCLALLAKKNYVSKNHTATLLFVIKYYSQIDNEDLNLIEELQVKEEDAKFYTRLKVERHNANYSTNLFFDNEKIISLKRETIRFLNKVKGMVEN